MNRVAVPAERDDERWMRRALELAERGQGCVEPNPMVGCVVVRDGQCVGEGFHPRFGAAHAEVAALAEAGDRAVGATIYVTLEPCCHHGKTPPCTEAIIQSGIRRVVAAVRDPFPKVDGGGFSALSEAGIDSVAGCLESESRELNAPYFKLIEKGRPWVIAKWAMTLDGRIATRTGDSQWISGEASREVVHRIRGRVDAILVGRRTVELDDPLLTARPAGPRVATRVVCDSAARLPHECQLVRTAREFPTLIAVGPEAPQAKLDTLQQAGCETIRFEAPEPTDRLACLLDELGKRRMTNLLVEGGGRILGSFFDGGLVNEVHVFVGPKIVGGSGPTPVGGIGVQRLSEAYQFASLAVETLGGDAYLHGRIVR